MLLVSYNVSASVEGLISAVELVVNVRPILQLDCGIGSRGYGVRDVGNLVALVTRLNLRDVANDLLTELALDSWCWGSVSVEVHDIHDSTNYCHMRWRS